jgi:hypothetical protein
MNTSNVVEATHEELRKKLLEINVWAMTLVLALVLESASVVAVSISALRHPVEAKVWAGVFIMALVFGLLLATTVGILVLHVRFQAPYRYWYSVLDNVFITVPLYVAVKFIGASINVSGAGAATVRLDEGMFRIGAALISLALAFLAVRDLIVLPKIRTQLSVPPLVAVSALHSLGMLLFLSLAIAPGLVLYVAVAGSIGLSFFFAGMAAIPVIEARFAPQPSIAAAQPGGTPPPTGSS